MTYCIKLITYNRMANTLSIYVALNLLSMTYYTRPMTNGWMHEASPTNYLLSTMYYLLFIACYLRFP